jgi:hypothetical protein
MTTADNDDSVDRIIEIEKLAVLDSVDYEVARPEAMNTGPHCR